MNGNDKDNPGFENRVQKRYGNIEEDSSLNEDGIEKSMIQIENSEISLISRMNHLEDEISGLKER